MWGVTWVTSSFTVFPVPSETFQRRRSNSEIAWSVQVGTKKKSSTGSLNECLGKLVIWAPKWATQAWTFPLIIIRLLLALTKYSSLSVAMHCALMTWILDTKSHKILCFSNFLVKIFFHFLYWGQGTVLPFGCKKTIFYKIPRGNFSHNKPTTYSRFVNASNRQKAEADSDSYNDIKANSCFPGGIPRCENAFKEKKIPSLRCIYL